MTVGFDDKEITRILFVAESRKAGSGLTAVVGATDKEITRILFVAESRKAGSGLTAVVGATAERRQRLDAEESAARIGDLDVDAVRSSVWKRDAVPRGFLGATTKRAEKIVAKARAAASLDDEEIVRIRKESELMVAGSGWGAVVEATAKQEAAIVKAAWEVFHDVEEIARVHDASELKRSGSGWEAVVEVTAERRKRKDAAESSARDAGLDVEAVYENAVTRDVDPIDFLERATAKQEEEIEAAARAVLLDDEEITRIRKESELQEAGSGWGAVVEATAERRKRKDAAESSARDAGLDVEAVYENAVTRDVDLIGLPGAGNREARGGDRGGGAGGSARRRGDHAHPQGVGARPQAKTRPNTLFARGSHPQPLR